MGLQTSGPISIGDINVELERSKTTPTTSLHSAEIGSYGIIRSSASIKPNGSNPNKISEWYGYIHKIAILNFNTGANIISVNATLNNVIYGAGQFSTYGLNTRNNIIQIDDVGNEDINFLSGTGFNNLTTKTIIMPDGKITVLGSFTTYKGVTWNGLVRLRRNGGHDWRVHFLNSGFNGLTKSGICLSDNLTDGQSVIIVGAFTTYKGVTSNRIQCIEYEGNAQPTSYFNPGTGFNNTVNDIVKQSNGTMVIAGEFTTYNSVTANRIVRILSTGSVDTSFNSGSGFNSLVNRTVTQSDGKILAVGDFTSYNVGSVIRICRLTSTGGLDTSFNPGTGFNNTVFSIALQSDGKMIVVGSFTTFNGNSANYIIRLLSTGSVDTSFNTGSGFNGNANDVSIHPNGLIVIGGYFTTYKGINCSKIIVLNTDGSIYSDSATTYYYFTFENRNTRIGNFSANYPPKLTEGQRNRPKDAYNLWSKNSRSAKIGPKTPIGTKTLLVTSAGTDGHPNSHTTFYTDVTVMVINGVKSYSVSPSSIHPAQWYIDRIQPFIPDTTSPTAPSNLTASSITQTTLTLTWTASTDNIGVTNYLVYKDSVLLTTLGNVLTYNVTGLTDNTNYNFMIFAKDAAGNVSFSSNILSVNTLSYITYTFYESYQDSPCGSLRDLYRRDDNNEFYYFDGSSYVTANALFWYQFFDYDPIYGEYIYSKYLVSYTNIWYEGTENSYCSPV